MKTVVQFEDNLDEWRYRPCSDDMYEIIMCKEGLAYWFDVPEDAKELFVSFGNWEDFKWQLGNTVYEYKLVTPFGFNYTRYDDGYDPVYLLLNDKRGRLRMSDLSLADSAVSLLKVPHQGLLEVSYR